MRICGLDEVGRGALAGPLVATGVILPTSHKASLGASEFKDSKKLNPKQREELSKKIIKSGSEIVVEVISVRQINNRGMGWANKEIFGRIIKKMEADKYIVDGNLKIKIRNKIIKSVIKADAARKCVMAASIVAKVFRDEHMNKLHDEHPKYGWKVNKGYGTKKHIEAIKEFGTVKYHRDVFVTTALSSHIPFDKQF